MIIVDDVISPYYVEVSKDGNYMVREDKVSNEGNVYKETKAYCSNMPSALSRIIKLKVDQSEETLTLKEYIKKYHDIHKEILKSIKLPEYE